jgi:hypothetical protein
MACDDIHKALVDFSLCEETTEGARIATHCLYPSFESVRVFVARISDGFNVHDGSGAYNAAWLHGRDDPMIINSIKTVVANFRLELFGKSIIARAKSIDWLPSAIVSVANASSLAAHDAVAKITAAAEEALVDRIDRKLSGAFGPKGYDKDVEILGVSGGMRHFDFVVGRRSPAPLFINGVLPHKISIASKYVSFADTEADKRHKFAVHDRELDNDDTLLLQQVASVVPFLSLAGGAQRLFVSRPT